VDEDFTFKDKPKSLMSRGNDNYREMNSIFHGLRERTNAIPPHPSTLLPSIQTHLLQMRMTTDGEFNPRTWIR
jgi:hypothetical protein